MRYEVFVDGGFFRKAVEDFERARGRHRVAASRVSFDARRLKRYLSRLPSWCLPLKGHALREVLVYEAQYNQGVVRPEVLEGRRRYFDALRHHGLVVRTGRLVPAPPSVEGPLRSAIDEAAAELGVAKDDLRSRVQARLDHSHKARPVVRQKGVDVLLALDLVRRAHDDAYRTAVLVTGDADLAPAVDHVRRLGRGVLLLAPPGARRARRPSIARALERAVDGVEPFGETDFAAAYRLR